MIRILPIILTFIIFSVFSLPAFAQTSQNESHVEGIVLSKNRIESVPCPGYSNDIAQPVRVIEVETRTQNEYPIHYDYSVSGGRIEGNGKYVKWDLTDLPPGTYTITVSVKGNNGFQKTFKSIVNSYGCYIIDCLMCPILTVRGPAKKFKAGDIITFSVEVRNFAGLEILYDWKISGGKIIKGQGTHQITVLVQKSKDNNVTANIKIGGGCPGCSDETISKSLTVNYKK